MKYEDITALKQTIARLVERQITPAMDGARRFARSPRRAIAGLTVTDVEILRLHYAETLAAWYVRFQANRDRVAALFDERFCRMWEFYLLSSEIGFRYGGQMVFQMQLAKALETLPITRDYMSQQETNGMSC